MNIFRQITANSINIEAYDFRQELAMQAYLLENEEILKLDNEDFNEVRMLNAEVSLKDTRADRDGRIDILAQYGDDYLGIVELKLEEINEDTLHQLEEYLSQKEQLMEKYWENKSNELSWVGVMVGTSISPDLQKKLQDGYKIGDVPIAGMVLRRFRSENNEIFVISDTFFKNKAGNKDYSKFNFQGQIYNKSRLVHRVVKALVEADSNITYAELERLLPPNIQGTLGVFTRKENALSIHAKKGHKRHYINPDEFIQLVDATIATCNQWDTQNVSRFIEKINQMDEAFTISRV